ncbi:hypothetical protein CEXT_92992 [Caerostris extrusa]|uniref:Uncharacterized protein n=1 Tax=Caerostris extrusa TaxID=172846 RepID=A0AAV4Q850_CAEEX|nr:hypothetical protein CEXT_92992 [Caerostris extrusa]
MTDEVPTSQHSSSSQDSNAPVITKWVDTNEDQLPNVRIQTSRSGRKRKVKNMTDFIYDPYVLSDHSCESQPTEENIQPIPKDFCSTPVVENGNNLDISGGSSALEVPEDICILDVNRVENDDVQILNVSKKAIQHNSKDVFTDDSSQINENGIIVVNLENVIPSDNLTEVKVEYPNNSSFCNPEKHLQQREPKNYLKSLLSSSSTIVENQSHNQGIASKNVEHLLQENLSTIYSAISDESLSSKIDSTLTPNLGQLDDVVLNQMSSTDQLMQTSIQEPLTVSQVAPAAVNIIPEHPSDSAPVVIFTRTRNDSQMLHLFLYNNSNQL